MAAKQRQERATAVVAAVWVASEEKRQTLNTKAGSDRQGAARELAMEKAALARLAPPDLEPLESDQMPRAGLAHRGDGGPTTTNTQRNFTDPDRHIMKGNGEIIQEYNGQADVEFLGPMRQRTIANTGACPTTFIADAGYWSEDNAEIGRKAQTDPHRATGRQMHGLPPAATTGRLPKKT